MTLALALVVAGAVQQPEPGMAFVVADEVYRAFWPGEVRSAPLPTSLPVVGSAASASGHTLIASGRAEPGEATAEVELTLFGPSMAIVAETRFATPKHLDCEIVWKQPVLDSEAAVAFLGNGHEQWIRWRTDSSVPQLLEESRERMLERSTSLADGIRSLRESDSELAEWNLTSLLHRNQRLPFVALGSNRLAVSVDRSLTMETYRDYHSVEFGSGDWTEGLGPRLDAEFALALKRGDDRRFEWRESATSYDLYAIDAGVERVVFATTRSPEHVARVRPER